jgi:1,4-alpha-glucan branching enzyme
MSKHNHQHEKSSPGSRAKAKFVEVHFTLEKPQAECVYVSGDFNGWSATSVRMIRREGNCIWDKRLTLPPGRYEYKFVVDGEWIADPAAREQTSNAYGSLNSVVEVQ